MLTGRNGKSIAAASAEWAYERVMMKGRLSWLLIYVLPLFPITYALGLIKILDRDQVIASNMICSVFAKLIFVGILSLESLFVQLAQRGSDSRRKALNSATLEGFSLKGRIQKGAFGTAPKPKYDSLSQVSSVEDEVNFNLVKVRNDNQTGLKNGIKGGNLNGKGWMKSASDGPLPGTQTPPVPPKNKGISTGDLPTKF